MAIYRSHIFIDIAFIHQSAKGKKKSLSRLAHELAGHQIKTFLQICCRWKRKTAFSWDRFSFMMKKTILCDGRSVVTGQSEVITRTLKPKKLQSTEIIANIAKL